ncbi:MAG TPA: TetR/AcrR family transcriptional regulator [Candidatus Acidoferrales bacterium]|nr:TetR/AcrR family transcriptional regulator [Candidatus Acidoferrales bacterium]
MARTRSVKAHGKVLDAAIELFVESGIDATSMDAIAGRSGVSKATIYKHWPDKDALALEALSHLFGFYEEAPSFDSGDLQQDFVDALTYQPAQATQELKRKLMPHVMGYAARNRKFGDQWRSRMIDRPQTRLKNLIKRGIKQHEFVRNIDMTIGIALLMGPAFYWYIVIGKKSSTAAMPRAMAAEVVRAFFRAYGHSR